MKYTIDEFFTGTQRIRVLDAMMGLGKTEAVMQLFERYPDTKFVFVTPNIITRESQQGQRLQAAGFEIPDDGEDGKGAFYLESMQRCARIVVTHALFKLQGKETKLLLREHRYIVVIDEVPDVGQKIEQVAPHLQPILANTVFEHDARTMLLRANFDLPTHHNMGYATSVDFDKVFNKITSLANNGNLAYAAGLFQVVMDVSYWNDLEGVIILTHDYKRSLFARWMSLQGHEVGFIDARALGLDVDAGIENLTRNLKLCQFHRKFEGLEREQEKMLFSASWYRSMDSKGFQEVSGYLGNVVDTAKDRMSSRQVLWTCRKADAGKLKWKGKSENHTHWIPNNMRGSNDYSDIPITMCLYNYYLDPSRKALLKASNDPEIDDDYASSNLMQWVYRGTIRQRQLQYVILLESRMRRIFEESVKRLAAA